MAPTQSHEGDQWRNVDRLRALLEELAELGASQFSRISAPSAPTDLYAHMVLTFLCRQLDHAESLLRLESNRDVVLIARSMIEGMVQLEWASLRPGERAKRWLDFQHIDRWRLARSWLKQGLPVDTDVVREAEKSARRVGLRYLKEKQEKRRKAGKKLDDDPYASNWYGMTFYKLCGGTTTDYRQKYVTFYKEFSEWHHWSPSGVAPAIEVAVPGRIAYLRTDSTVSEKALANGFQALAVTMQHVDERLVTGIGAELQELADKYSAAKGVGQGQAA